MQALRLKRDRLSVDDLYDAARQGTLEQALIALGDFATGHPGFALFAGHGLRVLGSLAPLVGPGGPVAVKAAEAIPDPVLEGLGLEWLRTSAIDPIGRRAQLGALILRAGLLSRILDKAYRHLEPRESGGQRTLQHQLVKAAFVESYGAAEQMRREAPYLLDRTLDIDLSGYGSVLTHATMRAAKLMGGHGYLLGETNSIEFLSLCIASISSQPVAGSRGLRSVRPLQRETLS